MFLRNARWLRRSTTVVLVLVVTLAGLWPLVSQSATRGVEIFQRYAEVMSADQALQRTLQAEFCGQLPAPDPGPADWDAPSSANDGKLILLTPARSLPVRLEVVSQRTTEPLAASLWTFAPEPPPPRV